MTNIEIIERLEKRLEILYKKGEHGDTGYIWSEVINICKGSISLFNEYEISTKNQEEVRLKSIHYLKKAIDEANKYPEPNEGFNVKEMRNKKFMLYRFLRPAREGIEHFIYNIEEKPL